MPLFGEGVRLAFVLLAAITFVVLGGASWARPSLRRHAIVRTLIAGSGGLVLLTAATLVMYFVLLNVMGFGFDD
jgi:hypothetical protein